MGTGRTGIKGKGTGAATIYVVGPVPPPYCGHAIMTAHAINALRAAGYRVTVFNLADAGRMGRSGVFSAGRLAEIVWVIFRLFGQVTIRRPALVYITPAQSSLGAVRDLVITAFLQLTNVPYVLHFHGAHFAERYHGGGRWLRRAFHRMLSKARSLVVVADEFRAQFDAYAGENRIRVVRNCVEEDVVPSDAELRARVAAQGRRHLASGLKVLFLSNLTRAKGVCDAIEACRLLIDAGISTQFVFAGGWPADDTPAKVKRLVDSLGLQQNVSFVGVVVGESKRRLLLDADVFILPSYNEAVPVAILEAMACGLPVVATRVGAIPEVIVDGKNGFLVEPGDTAAMAARLRELAQHPDMRQWMGVQNAHTVRQGYTVDHFTREFIKVIRDSLAS